VGAQGDRGVFITTSTFSWGARGEAERVDARIGLIGLRVAELMLRPGVGVQAETTVTLHQPDEDFFESLLMGSSRR
jgi:restriction system protein